MAGVSGLLEREDELGVLVAAVDMAAAGCGCVVFLGGEAGIGKTSLVRALRDRMGERVCCLIAGCEPLSVPVPLARGCRNIGAVWRV
jgi:predicted ATPase